MPVLRYDSAPIKATRTDAGFLRGEANVTRTGVFTYRNADGSERKELRLPEEVFKPLSMNSLSMAPITLGHPLEAVTSKNAKALAVGAVGDSVKADGKFLRASYVIHDDAAITEIESGRQRELSCGYNCDLEMKSGVYEGERYDAIQRNINHNHLAILARGRAGPEVRIDGDDAVCIDGNETPTKRNSNMIKLHIDGVDIEVSETAAQIIKRAQMKLEDEVKRLTKDAADASAALAKAQGRADGLDAEVKTLKQAAAPEALTKLINERVSLVNKADKILSTKEAPFKADGLSDDEIKRQVILKVQPTADLKDKSADYVNARFDAAIEASTTTVTNADGVAAANGDARKVIAHADGSATGNKVAEAQKRMKERNSAAWKPKATA
jgi:hypothetical protein